MIKKITYTIGVIFFLWWFFLSHVTFLVDSKINPRYDEDSGYYIKYVEPLPINFFGAYFWIFNFEDAPIFIVLYDENNNYVGQSSPFGITDNINVADANKLFPHEKFPLFGLVDIDAYDIPIDRKKWWSYILQYFH